MGEWSVFKSVLLTDPFAVDQMMGVLLTTTTTTTYYYLLTT